MEAFEFLKAVKRRYLNTPSVHSGSIYLNEDNLEEFVKEVEEWAKENPAKTRQTEFLKMFPHMCLDTNGIIDMPPCNVDKEVYDECNLSEACIDCDECRKVFWNEEVE